MGSAGINAGIFYTTFWYKLYHIILEEAEVMPVISQRNY